MGKTLMTNNGPLPRPIGSRWVQPGESIAVDDGAASPAPVDVRFQRGVGGAVSAIAGDTGQAFGLLSTEKAAAVDALVSPDGNLAYAAVASTTGTPGEVRKLSDGPDKGAALVWAIPEGRTTYAWCWQIYPLAAYL